MINKCLHVCLNKRPVDCTKRLKAIFQQLYRDFMIPDKTIPFVFMHFEMSEQMYDVKLMADMRKFFFKPETEKMVYEKLRTYFLSEFNKMCPKYSKAKLSEPTYQDMPQDLEEVYGGSCKDDEVQQQRIQMIKETHGKMKQFIKKRIKFRKYPNKKSINVYVLEEANKLLN